MAEEGFEPYHVPQQSRRDKLRVVVAQNQPTLVESSSNTLPPGCASLLPLYDPSLISSDLLTCATQHHHQQQQHHGFHHHSNNNETSKPNNLGVKEERSSLMMGFGAGVGGGVMNGSSSSSSSNSSSVSHHHHAYLDPQSSNLPLNPGGSIQVFGNNPFLYQAQNLREFDHGYSAGGEIMVFKPEPLSLSLSSHNSNHHQGTNNLPLELNLQRYGSVIYGDKASVGVGGGCVIPGLVGGGGNSASASNEVSRSSVPMGPFTGYASILKGSRFLKPAQQLLEELCDVGGGVCAEEKIMVADASLMEPPPPMDCLSAGGIGPHHEDPLVDHGVEGRKKSRLLTMLDEVCFFFPFCFCIFIFLVLFFSF